MEEDDQPMGEARSVDVVRTEELEVAAAAAAAVAAAMGSVGIEEEEQEVAAVVAVTQQHPPRPPPPQQGSSSSNNSSNNSRQQALPEDLEIDEDDESEDEDDVAGEDEGGDGGGGDSSGGNGGEVEVGARGAGGAGTSAAGGRQGPSEVSRKRKRKEARMIREAEEGHPLLSNCNNVTVLTQQHKVLPNSRLPGHASRRYRPIQLIGVNHVEGCDMCLLNHRNGLYIICLALTHQVVVGAAEDKVVGVTFGANMINARPSGKKKHGAVGLSQNATLCTISLASGKSIALPACVPGTLVEINPALADNPELAVTDPLDTGYIGIMFGKERYNAQTDTLCVQLGFPDDYD